jgi:hypothetical protein
LQYQLIMQVQSRIQNHYQSWESCNVISHMSIFFIDYYHPETLLYLQMTDAIKVWDICQLFSSNFPFKTHETSFGWMNVGFSSVWSWPRRFFYADSAVLLSIKSITSAALENLATWCRLFSKWSACIREMTSRIQAKE